MISGSSRQPFLLDSVRVLNIFSVASPTYNLAYVGLTKEFLNTMLFSVWNFILSPTETFMKNEGIDNNFWNQ